jgi:LppX_LprAFG lipoprotein
VKAVLAALALGATLALAACGSTVSLDPVAKAADHTTAKGSEHVTYSGSVGVSGQTLQMTGAGDFQNDPRLGSMAMTMHGGGVNATVDAVMQGSTVYMRSSLFSSALPQGKSWVSIDVQKAGKKLGLDVSQFAQQSPTDTLAALEEAGSVTKVGDETVNGEATTHYKATIDFSKVPNGAAIQKLTNLQSVPVDVWIGSDGLLRRLTEQYSAGAAGQTTTTSLTMNFSNYGEPVFVHVPSAAETVDMTKLGG